MVFVCKGTEKRRKNKIIGRVFSNKRHLFGNNPALFQNNPYLFSNKHSLLFVDKYEVFAESFWELVEGNGCGLKLSDGLSVKGVVATESKKSMYN